MIRGGVEDTRLEAKAKDTKKFRGQGQPFRGQTLSRPRTGMLEAKDQGHSRKCSPKKVFKKSFSSNLQFIRVARIFDWLGGPKHESHAITSSKIFKRETVCGTKISQDRRFEIVAGWHLTRILQKEMAYVIVEKCKYLTLETCWES